MTNVVLCGLTRRESVEFHLLDASMPFEWNPVWPDRNMSASAAERRWLELWSRHVAALNKTGTATPTTGAAPWIHA